MLFMGSPLEVGESTPRRALGRDPLPVLRRSPLVESRRGFLTRALGLAVVALRAGIARRRAAQEPQLRVDPRAGVADREVKAQHNALRETELPVEPLGNQAARLLAGELQLHCARHLVMRLSRTIASPGKRADSYEPCTEAPSSWSP